MQLLITTWLAHITINGITKNDYRTRVCQVLVKEGKNWKVKSGDFTPLHSGSGIPD